MLRLLQSLWRFFLGGFYFVLVGLTFLALLGPFVPPHASYLPMIAALGFPLLLLGQFFFFVYYWWRNRRMKWLATVMFFLCLPYVGQTLQFGAGGEPQLEKSLVVMTGNFRGFSEMKPNWNAFRALNQESSTDILVIQEFGSTKKSQQNKLDSIRAINPALKHLGQVVPQRAVLSKYPIFRKGMLDLGDTKNGVGYYDLIVQKDTFRLYNVHLQSNYISGIADDLVAEPVLNERKTYSKMKAMLRLFRSSGKNRTIQVKALTAHLAKSPYPTIVAGDFNDVPLSYAYRAMAKTHLDAFRFGGSGIGSTYSGSLPWLRIDYLFADPFFRLTDFQRHTADVSDHYAISCHFSWASKPKSNK